uniref:Uncharacterized protein n=1 Tax=Anguilla anguilla TaxID=7936 RepID=A0A0E9WU01_ANGAN
MTTIHYFTKQCEDKWISAIKRNCRLAKLHCLNSNNSPAPMISKLILSVQQHNCFIFLPFLFCSFLRWSDTNPLNIGPPLMSGQAEALVTK